MKPYILSKITIGQAVGFLVFAFSGMLYLITLSPTVNFWDSGEFIACANGLEVGHAPGAPLYLMLARMFGAFVPAVYVAVCINFLSAMASAATIWLLYSTLLLILKKVQQHTTDSFSIISASIASLTFAFTDTFWFSAVEAEVYALSLFFTAFTLWAVLKWENELTSGGAYRWLLLIAFAMGLSVGVHLLNLLCIPVVVYWVYIHLNKNKKNKHAVGLLLGMAVLLMVQFFAVQNGLFIAKKIELLFVNSFHLPVHSGLLFFIVLLFSFLVVGIYLYRKKNQALHFLFVAATLFVIGLSSYAMVIIRANAQPAINLNSPTDVFSLESFINREQYGERPLLRGAWFGAEHYKTEAVFNYRLNNKGRYELYEKTQQLIYDKDELGFMQRMYSPQKHHVEGYRYWSGLQAGEKPTLMHQLDFLLKYQLGHMYFRYFMWNFSGRQNHYQGHGDFLNGNFATGLAFIDKHSLGSRHYLHTNELTSKARNYYFMLPLLFGLGGILLLIKKKRWDMLLFLGLLFLLTGAAIALYLNQPPYEPRERDYVFVGSFYAYAIFIGLGVWALLQKIAQLSPSSFTRWTASLAVLLALPGLMISNNFDDHNRSDRILALDLATSYLQSCGANGILFTYGDNDTYPLWYLQEVEGIRRDVSVVNMGLLSADWYVRQQTIRQRGREPLRLTIPLERYKSGDLDYVGVINRSDEPMTLNAALNFAGDTAAASQLTMSGGNKLDYLPSDKFRLGVNPGSILKIDKSYLMKGEIALLDIIATNGSNRPIYFGNGTPPSAMVGLNDLVQPYGIVGKLSPNKSQPDTDELYRLLDEKVGISAPTKSWWDQTCADAVRLSGLQHAVQALANDLLKKGKKYEARHLLKKHDVFHFLVHSNSIKINIPWIQVLYKADLNDEALAYLKEYAYAIFQNIGFYRASEPNLGENMLYYAMEEEENLKQLRAVAKDHGAIELVQQMDEVLGQN